MAAAVLVYQRAPYYQAPSSLPSTPSFPLDALLPSCRSTPAPSAAAAGVVLLLGAATVGLPRATAAQCRSPARGTASRSRRWQRTPLLRQAGVRARLDRALTPLAQLGVGRAGPAPPQLRLSSSSSDVLAGTGIAVTVEVPDALFQPLASSTKAAAA
ncbi:uncharacterized protein [Setaria viridis]|uniref:uncharacterized protein n=1 Tax=Setaria viridis TaxID=4556 RepID=UPI003B3BDEF0